MVQPQRGPNDRPKKNDPDFVAEPTSAAELAPVPVKETEEPAPAPQEDPTPQTSEE